MWLVTGLGITVGYHRLFTHRAFATNTAVSALLVAMGSMAAQGTDAVVDRDPPPPS